MASDAWVHWKLPDDPGGAWGSRRTLAASVRELSERIMTSEADQAAMDRAVALVDAAVEALPPGLTALERFSSGGYEGRSTEMIDRIALMGRCNPMAPPMIVDWDGEVSICKITLTEVHCGAPGMAHGGVLSAVLDQLAGHVLVMSRMSGFTAKLTVRYLKPTPLHQELVMRGWVERTSGRRVTVACTIELGDVRLIEASALLVEMDQERAQRIIRGARPDAD